MRLFVAIEVPEAWREAAWRIGAALDEAARDETAHDRATRDEATRDETTRDEATRDRATRDKAARGVLRRVDRSRMHLTLRFLGEVEDELLPALRRELERHIRSASLELALGHPGTFGGPARTSVVWLGVTGDLAQLHTLADEVEEAIISAGLVSGGQASGAPSAGRHQLRPHLTVARVRRSARPAQRRALAAAVEAVAAPPPQRFRVERLVLVRSQLRGDGPRYDEIARFRLPPSGLESPPGPLSDPHG